MNKVTEEQLKEVYNLCVDVEAHCRLDYEITIDGNGCNACEASYVTYEIVKLLGFDNEVQFERDVESTAKTLEELYD